MKVIFLLLPLKREGISYVKRRGPFQAERPAYANVLREEIVLF